MTEREYLLDLDPEGLARHLDSLGQPAFRWRQIFDWIFRQGVTDFGVMTNLPQPLRRHLAESFLIRVGRQQVRQRAPDGTVKLLLAWRDGTTSETVMIPASGARPRRTVCLSTQVGCDVGCRFCASGIGGSARDLTVGEVLEQALVVRDLLRETGERLSHVVFMGIGEPLANYEVTVEAVRRINASWGLGIAQRRITISTVGLPKQIERLAGEGLQATLALSLHAPNDPLRRQLIPWAKGLPLERLLQACRVYRRRTGRDVTLEYCLLSGVNDLDRHADELGRIARELRAHVNLLLYNPVQDLPFHRPSRQRGLAFLARLRAQGVRSHLRESRGLRVEAACGQLRRRESEVPPAAAAPAGP